MEANATHHILVRNFTLLSEDELLMILERRNHPDIRRRMVQTDPITPEDHLRYCASLRDHPETLQLLVEFDGKPASVLSYKALDSSWQEVSDCGIYAFDPEPCTSSILSSVVGGKLVIERNIKVMSIKVKNDNEIAIFTNQYYYDFHVVKKDLEFTYMSKNFDHSANFYQEYIDRLLLKLDAILDFKI